MKKKSLPAVPGRYKLVVVSTFNFYFKLALLCFRLAFNLLVFSFKMVLAKINKNFLWNTILLILLLTSLLGNFYFWQEKNTPKKTILFVPLDRQLLGENLQLEKKLLSKEQINEQLATYQDLEKQGVQNKAIFLNLSQFKQILGEQDSSSEYSSKAKKI